MTRVNLEEGLIKADFVIDVKTISNEQVTEAYCCNYHFVFLFQLENLKDHAQLLEDGNFDWNPYLANAIASISYSTSRGILIARFQGPVMRDFILPVVDPNSLWEKKQQPIKV